MGTMDGWVEMDNSPQRRQLQPGWPLQTLGLPDQDLGTNAVVCRTLWGLKEMEENKE